MKRSNRPQTATAELAEALKSLNTATAQTDRLLNFRQVAALTGSACKTGHHARALAARGQIRAVRINERVIRYSEQSVLALIAGRVDPVSRDQAAAAVVAPVAA